MDFRGPVGTVVDPFQNMAAASMRPQEIRAPAPVSVSLPSLPNPVSNAPHKLAAAQNGVVYVIWQDPSTARTTVWIHTEHVNGFKKVGSKTRSSQSGSISFRCTSRPFISIANTFYIGGKKLPSDRPAVFGWKGETLFCSLESTRPVGTNWEYTVLTQSSIGTYLYCGCSDGAIELWRHVDQNQPRVYDRSLTGHRGAICALAVGNDGILISVDDNNRNIVRVWRTQEQVVKLDLGSHQVHRLVCTMDGFLYIMTRAERPARLWCNVKNLVDLAAAAARPGHVRSVYGLEKFSQLQHPQSGPTATHHTVSCFVPHGASRTVYFLSMRPHSFASPTYFVEEWRGNEFVGGVDIGLREFRSWSVSRNGTLYVSSLSTGEIFRWRLAQSSSLTPSPGLRRHG
ncbi:hypothetical protein M758_10G067400 [Ceratodon purpureus]|nr:hypothetical protein M758_10G067400 [Ceratodon purpureus]